jgi:hypothetical protein
MLLKLAGFLGIAIKYLQTFLLPGLVPIMEYCGEVWGADLCFMCDTNEKVWKSELQKVHVMYLRQPKKFWKSVATTISHLEMRMQPVAKK